MSAPSPEEAIPAPTTTIPPTVKGLAAVSLLNDFASEMVYPLLPAFLVGTLGGSATLLGALDGAAEFASAVMKRVSGGLSDRPGWRKPLIAIGYFSAILIRPLMAAAAAAWQVVGFRVIDRVGKGLRTPARDALISEVTPPAIRGRAYGFHNAADHFGSILGALLAWWLLSHTVDVRRVLGLSVIPGIAAGIFVLFVLRQSRPGASSSDQANAQARAPRAATTPAAVPVAREERAVDATGRTFWLPVAALALLVLLRLPETLLLLRLQQLGVGVSSIPLVWAGLHVVRTAVSYPGGWLTDRVGPRAMVAAGGACFAAGVGCLGLHLSAGAAVGVFLAMGLCAGLSESSERVLVTRLAPKRTGRGFGAYHAVTGLAALPAATSFGFLYHHGGGAVALAVSAAGMIAGTIVWLAAMPRARRA